MPFNLYDLSEKEHENIAALVGSGSALLGAFNWVCLAEDFREQSGHAVNWWTVSQAAISTLSILVGAVVTARAKGCRSPDQAVVSYLWLITTAFVFGGFGLGVGASDMIIYKDSHWQTIGKVAAGGAMVLMAMALLLAKCCSSNKLPASASTESLMGQKYDSSPLASAANSAAFLGYGSSSGSQAISTQPIPIVRSGSQREAGQLMADADDVVFPASGSSGSFNVEGSPRPGGNKK